MKHIYTQMLLGRARNPLAYTNKIKALGPIAYYPQAEPSGTTIGDESGNGRNGTYVGVTLGQPGIGDGRTAAGYNGATSYGNIYSASLAAAFNGAEGSFCMWVRYLGTVSDGVTRRMGGLQVNASNRIVLTKITDGRYGFTYAAGGVTVSVNSGLITSALTHWAITWSKSADQMKAYVNGVQFGATQTGLGTFAGALSTTQVTVMAGSTTPIEAANGVAAHTAIFNRALSAAEIASLAVVP